MRKLMLLAIGTGLSVLTAAGQVQSWKGIHHTPLSEAATMFNDTPDEFASHLIWGWEGPMDIATIRHDLDSIKSKGFRSVIFEAGYHLPYEYLSDEWFKGIRTGVREAKKRGLKVWIIDEGKYPSGFAGGKFTRERPEMRMKAVVAVDTLHVPAGTSLKGHEVSSKAISAVAISRTGAPNRTVIIDGGKIDFEAGSGAWDILFAGTDYRTGPTRAVNNPTGGKDTNNSICDYLSPEAVRQFIDWTHEQYKKYIGNEFGKTVLGFRGDEPDFAYTPWTPDMVEEFRSRKGYDPTPYLASLIAPVRTVKENRFRADYWDVWSELFAVNFFKQQADWCEENGLAHITHLNNDHNMPVCIRAEGNLFRDLSKVQVPGVDAIWNQIWPGTTNDFPKFASSVSHVYGKPRAFSESFAAYYTSPSIPQAKYVVDYQIVRGINFFEFMFWMAGSEKPNWMTDPGMKGLNEYTNRATYMNALGVPGARIAVYYPSSTFWLGNQAVNDDLVGMASILLRNQRDFDWVDDDAFTEALEVRDGGFVNLSGQVYGTLIIPSCDAISVSAWEKINEFALNGGKVLFWGRKPTMLYNRTFTAPYAVPDTPDWFHEPSSVWTATVDAAMPEPEMRIIRERAVRTQAGPGPQQKKAVPEAFIRYTRRVMPDGDLYFIFNEGEEACSFTAEFDRTGKVRLWNAEDGTVSDFPETGIIGGGQEGKTLLKLDLDAWQSVMISIE